MAQGAGTAVKHSAVSFQLSALRCQPSAVSFQHSSTGWLDSLANGPRAES